jgi:hypothetical protein
MFVFGTSREKSSKTVLKSKTNNENLATNLKNALNKRSIDFRNLTIKNLLKYFSIEGKIIMK